MQPVSLTEFAAKVEAMRQAQKNYYQAAKLGLSSKWECLTRSKLLEKEVDELVEKIIHPNNQLDLHA